MDRAEAIEILKKNRPGSDPRKCGEELCAAVDMAIAALREQEQREQGCEYCRGKEALYQHTNTTRLYINTYGQARTLVVECDPCPPYADCALKNNPARSVFIIKHCPECGRKLGEPPKEGDE